MWKKTFLGILILVALFLAYKIKTAAVKSTWNRDLKISSDGMRVVFSSGHHGEAESGIYVVDFESESWTFLPAPKRFLSSPIWTADSTRILVVSSSGVDKASWKSQVVQIDPNTGQVKVLFESREVLDNLSQFGSTNDIVYSRSPYCDLLPFERCGLNSDLYFYNNTNQTHHRLTKMWGGFSRPQFENDRTIVVGIPYFHLPDGSEKKRGKRCGDENIDNNIYRLGFPDPIAELKTPLEGNCLWRPLIQGASGSSSQPVLLKNGSEMLYLGIDRSKPDYFQSIYLRNFRTGKDQLIRETESTDWDLIDITLDGRYVVNISSNVPRIWRKDLIESSENEILAEHSNIAIVDLGYY